jgi:hypothetical protein
MWDEFRYRWRLRRKLRDYILTKKVHAASDGYTPEDGERSFRRLQQKERAIQEQEIAVLRSNYLIEQAYLYHVPVPENDDAWLVARYAGGNYLTPEAATESRNYALRSETKRRRIGTFGRRE